MTGGQSKVEHGGNEFRHLSCWADVRSGASDWQELINGPNCGPLLVVEELQGFQF